MEILIIVLVLGFGLFFVLPHFLGNPGFWKLTRQHPEAAYQWFLKEDCWVVQQGPYEPNFPLPQDRYVGPFRFALPRGGGLISIWCERERIEDSQQRFMRSL